MRDAQGGSENAGTGSRQGRGGGGGKGETGRGSKRGENGAGVRRSMGKGGGWGGHHTCAWCFCSHLLTHHCHHVLHCQGMAALALHLREGAIQGLQSHEAPSSVVQAGSVTISYQLLHEALTVSRGPQSVFCDPSGHGVLSRSSPPCQYLFPSNSIGFVTTSIDKGGCSMRLCLAVLQWPVSCCTQQRL